ncbi:hypothetical protein [Streptomyces sp. NPDC059262]|uniref:hypothetical protein n=1 Tax=Streptomyces sp. NPDC059262 TaxID=3346797 RepID=UPI00369707AA
MVAVITLGGSGLGFLGTITAPLITAAVSGDDKSDSDEKSTPSEPPSSSSSAGTDAGAEAEPSEAASPSPTPSASPSTVTYKVAYKDQKMQLGLPDFPSLGSLDFDEPATRIFSEDQWDQLTKDAESEERPLAQDLSYQSMWGYLNVREGRNAAQIDEAPKSAEECARSANLGGFSEAQMSDWPIKLHQQFCFLTDKGNVVSAEITRFVGGVRDSATDPPTQIEFTATMWQRA